MDRVIEIKGKKFVSIASAARILNYANRNSIDDLIRRGNLNVFKIPSLGTSWILLKDLQNLPRFRKIYEEEAN